MNFNIEYRVGDLLVKKQGREVVLIISEIKTYGSGNQLTLLDMKDGIMRKYLEEHVRSWLFYKHYPVRI